MPTYMCNTSLSGTYRLQKRVSIVSHGTVVTGTCERSHVDSGNGTWV